MPYSLAVRQLSYLILKNSSKQVYKNVILSKENINISLTFFFEIWAVVVDLFPGSGDTLIVQFQFHQVQVLI